MATSLPYPYPQLDLPGSPWDAFALLRNLQFLASRVDSINSVNQTSVLDRITGSPIATVANTVAETTVYTLLVPGGYIRDIRNLRITLVADILSNTGANRGFILRYKFGGTTFATLNTFGVFAPNATRYGFYGQPVLVNQGSTVQQAGSGYLIGETGAGITAQSNPTDLQRWSAHSSVAEDTSVNNDLVITVELEVASANLSFRVFAISIEGH